jgi:hypothetical protein
MKRTTVHIDDRSAFDLGELAWYRETSAAELIREAVTEYRANHFAEILEASRARDAIQAAKEKPAA